MGRQLFRTAMRLFFGLILVLSVPIPAHAQIMHDDGLSLPWFHTRAENLARQACEDNLPECRDSVRQQLVTEHMITTLAPWVLLALVILGAVMYTRRREAVREQRRHEAARHHVRETKRGRSGQGDVPTGRAAARDEAPDEDDLGLGRPGDHRN